MPGRAEGGMVRHILILMGRLTCGSPPSVSFADISPSRGESEVLPRKNPRKKTSPELSSGLALLPLSLAKLPESHADAPP